MTIAGMSMIAGFLAIAGMSLVVIAALGVIRMPDLYSRMQAASKAAPLGVALLAVAAALETGSAEVAVRAALLFGALCLTAPIAAHAIARAGYRSGVPLASEAVIDEMATATSPAHDPGPEASGR